MEELERKAQGRADERGLDDLLEQYSSIFFLSLPLPAWVKATDFRMLYINDAYEREFGVSKDEYVDKEDSIFWTAREVNVFKKHDKIVLKRGQAIAAKELIFNRITGRNERLEVIKWPILRDKKVVAMAGMVIERSPIPENIIMILLSLLPIKALKWLLKALSKRS